MGEDEQGRQKEQEKGIYGRSILEAFEWEPGDLCLQPPPLMHYVTSSGD